MSQIAAGSVKIAGAVFRQEVQKPAGSVLPAGFACPGHGKIAFAFQPKWQICGVTARSFASCVNTCVNKEPQIGSGPLALVSAKDAVGV